MQVWASNDDANPEYSIKTERENVFLLKKFDDFGRLCAKHGKKTNRISLLINLERIAFDKLA